MFGLTVEEASGPPVEVWPDNSDAVNVFIASGTQWRSGPAGLTGLDYGVLPTVMRMVGVPRPKWPDVFDGIRTMEDAALERMRRK
jgi:hypothetical protein